MGIMILMYFKYFRKIGIEIFDIIKDENYILFDLKVLIKIIRFF